MRKIVLFVFLTGIILIPVTAGDETTIWGPGENYKITFLHSGKLKTNDTTIKSFENLPVTEFEVSNFTKSKYTFNYLGYDNIAFNSIVEIIKYNDPDNLSIEYPSGGFPIVLPIKYNKHDDWIIYFSRQKYQTGIEDPYHFFNSSTTITEDFIMFNYNTTLNINFGQKNDIQAFSFMDISSLNGITSYNLSLSTTLSYTINTGTLYLMNYTLSNYNSNDTGNMYLSEQMDFVAIIPAIGILKSLGVELTGVFLGFIAVVVIKRRLLI